MDGFAAEYDYDTSKTSKRNRDLRGRAKSFARFHLIFEQSCHTMAVSSTP